MMRKPYDFRSACYNTFHPKLVCCFQKNSSHIGNKSDAPRVGKAVEPKFERFFGWYAVSGSPSKPIRTTLMRNAWLIGVYTVETECRIEDLGYSVSHVFATPSVMDSSLPAPDLIVFSDDGLNSLDAMETLKCICSAKALVISVAGQSRFLGRLYWRIRKGGQANNR